MNPVQQPFSEADIEDPAVIAATWVERLTAGDPSAAELADLRAWVAADPAHALAYDRARRIWVALPETSLRQRRPALRLVGGAVLAAAFALVLLWPSHHDHVTATGALAQLTLPDGTVAWLDSDSAIDLAFDGKRRTVRLVSGRAAFDVAQDAARPFAVEAGDARIVDIGTLFSVDRAEGLDVAVKQGAVDVALDGRSTRLEAGERARFEGDRSRRSKLSVDALGWRQRRLVFENERLDVILGDLDRYIDGRIIVMDGTLGARRVSGTLFTDRAGEGLDTIARSERLVVRRFPWLTLVSRAD